MDGKFFNISEKRFEENPETLVGSPRAFVLYRPGKRIPKPKPFIEGNLFHSN